MQTPPTIYVPPATPVDAVTPGGPVSSPVSLPSPVASPVVGPGPATYQTPQVVTGSLMLTNSYVAPLPPITPTVMAGVLWIILSYTLLWPWIENNLRYVLLAVALFTILLAIGTGSPQYFLGWAVFPVGLLFWRVFTWLVRPRAPGDL